MSKYGKPIRNAVKSNDSVGLCMCRTNLVVCNACKTARATSTTTAASRPSRTCSKHGRTVGGDSIFDAIYLSAVTNTASAVEVCASEKGRRAQIEPLEIFFPEQVLRSPKKSKPSPMAIIPRAATSAHAGVAAAARAHARSARRHRVPRGECRAVRCRDVRICSMTIPDARRLRHLPAHLERA